MLWICLNVVLLLSLPIAKSNKITIVGVDQCLTDKDYPIKWSAIVDKENSIVENGELNSSVDIGKDQMVEVNVNSFDPEKNEWQFVANIRERVCKVLKTYLGEFFEEIQKAAGIEPGLCPVPKGHYKISNHALDFTKAKFKNIPISHLNISIQVFDEMTNDALACMNLELSIAPNYFALPNLS